MKYLFILLGFIVLVWLVFLAPADKTEQQASKRATTETSTDRKGADSERHSRRRSDSSNSNRQTPSAPEAKKSEPDRSYLIEEPEYTELWDNDIIEREELFLTDSYLDALTAMDPLTQVLGHPVKIDQNFLRNLN